MYIEKYAHWLFNQLVILSVLFLLSTAPVHAQTEDAETPAVEAVCDPLLAEGVTKGLYGLCVAYCEAQDIASIEEPLTEGQIAALVNGKPSGKILDAYNKRKQEDDPDMVCITPVAESACPCFSSDELASIDGYNDETGEWVDLKCTNRDKEYPNFGHEKVAIIKEYTPVSPTSAYSLRLQLINSGTYRSCGYTDIGQQGNGETTITNRHVIDISEEQFVSCYEAIRKEIAVKCPDQI